MESKVYNQRGEETGTVTLPEAVFGLPWNPDLVHQVATSMQSNLRQPIAHAKGRGEVRGGGKKPWRQKGTGRARHGSIRSPLWVGGGAAHGPKKEKVFQRKINKRMKTKALFSALGKKWRDGEVLFIEQISLPASKAREARVVLQSLSKIKSFESISRKKKNAFYLALPKADRSVTRGFSNFPMVTVGELRNLNLLDLLQAKHLLFVSPKESMELLLRKNK